MAIELTPDVSPESGGFGFQVPVFRMNQGVNAATANPLSRGGMGQPMDMVSESQFGLNPNVLAMADEAARQEFYTGVDELNQFVNKAAEFGIDPSKVDMASPESFALNQEFRKRVQALQQQARGISTGAAQQALVDREMDRASMLESRELVKEQRQESIDQKRENRLSRKYLSGFKTQEDLLSSKARQDLTPSQAATFKKNVKNLLSAYDKKLSELEKSTESQEDKDFLTEELNMRKSQISPYLTGEASLYMQEGQPGLIGTPSLAPGQPLKLSSPVKMEGLMSPVVTNSGKIIQSRPTISQVVNLPYYTNNKGERIPVLGPDDPNTSRIEGTALVGVGFASRPNLTEGEIKKAVDQKRLSLLRERKANMSNQEMVAESKIIAETLKKFESDLRAQGSEDEQAYVVLPDDRAEQLLMSKGSTIAPTKRQVQKMTEVEKLMKSRGLNKK
jgi:hypothetical protein